MRLFKIKFHTYSLNVFKFETILYKIRSMGPTNGIRVRFELRTRTRKSIAWSGGSRWSSGTAMPVRDQVERGDSRYIKYSRWSKWTVVNRS